MTDEKTEETLDKAELVVEHTSDEHHAHEHESSEDVWSGAKEPFKASYGKLMMWYFLVTDAFTFAGFLIAYGALRFSSPSWPVPDFVFSTTPFGGHDLPLIFVTIMSFLLIISSVTMVRAVQEGHRENKRGVVFWMLLTVIGGAGFLGCQAWEWNNLINVENMSLTRNPFGTHTEGGTYLDLSGQISSAEGDVFKEGESYLLHLHHAPGEGHSHGEGHEPTSEEVFLEGANETIFASGLALNSEGYLINEGGQDIATEEIAGAQYYDFPGFMVNEQGYIQRKFVFTEAEDEEQTQYLGVQEFGPKAFGALFFWITGFHGFHVFSGVAFLTIVLINAGGGVYEARKNGYEMVEKIGLYWHFVDLVWVFVFLVFYLL
ncbi:MAG: cytochrome c oxidase subunit 3 [Bacteroidota bacterium]